MKMMPVFHSTITRYDGTHHKDQRYSDNSNTNNSNTFARLPPEPVKVWEESFGGESNPLLQPPLAHQTRTGSSLVVLLDAPSTLKPSQTHQTHVKTHFKTTTL